jgi:glycosyltransferase involved in cell wall biosynthesis
VRVCFVLPSLRPSGGVAVAAALARGLAEQGVEADLVVGEPAGGQAPEDLSVRHIAAADGRAYDVAIGTWWQTASALWEVTAQRRAMLLQSFEQRFYDRDAPFERLAAEVTLALPVGFLAVAPWIRDVLAELRPGACTWVVVPGIDKTVFHGERRVRRPGPLRVLIEGQPTLPFKGVQDAVAAVRTMREPVHSTLVALEPTAAEGLDVDRVVGGLGPEAMAALYRESDVLVKLSRVEGLGLAPVEGFHTGLPCVTTPYTGHDEYVRHGDNGVVVGHDDIPGTAAWLDLLARDRDLVAKLSVGAERAAAAWPSWTASARRLHGALIEMLEGPAAESDPSLLLRTLSLGTALGRARLARLDEQALAAAQAHVRELSASRDECSAMLDEARAELARVKGSRPYRAARAIKRAGDRLRVR